MERETKRPKEAERERERTGGGGGAGDGDENCDGEREGLVVSGLRHGLIPLT